MQILFFVRTKKKGSIGPVQFHLVPGAGAWLSFGRICRCRSQSSSVTGLEIPAVQRAYRVPLSGHPKASLRAAAQFPLLGTVGDRPENSRATMTIDGTVLLTAGAFVLLHRVPLDTETGGDVVPRIPFG